MKDFSSPVVSVIMPVYNAEQYIGEAVESILNQTLTNLELIIVDDGSTDGSVDLIRRYEDPRIIFIQNEKNVGNYPTRNHGMRLAQGKYIAVMDADDVAHCTRLQKEVDYLEEHPDTGIVSSWVLFSTGDVLKRPHNQYELKLLFLSRNTVPHSVMMMRKDLVEQYNWYYNEDFLFASDYELMTRAIFQTTIHIIPEILQLYRVHSKQISMSKREEQHYFARLIRQRYVIKLNQLNSL